MARSGRRDPPAADAFTERDLTTALEHTAQRADAVVLTQVLSGLGGVGKTQLAARYTRAQWEQQGVDLIVWVAAASTDSIVAHYAEAATHVLGADDSQPEQAARRLMAWLATTDKRWLIVLDDVTVPGDLTEWWPPTTPVGQAIVTTRYRGAGLVGPNRAILEVDVFTSEEARRYLHDKFADRPDLLGNDAHADALAAELGYLPIALAQAAAYMVNDDITTSQYRARLANQRTILADLLPGQDELPDAHRATLTAAWKLSIQRANQIPPVGLAAPVLDLASCLAPAGIPRSVFAAQPLLDYVGLVAGRDVTAEDVDKAVRVLHRFHLATATRTQPHRAVRVHGGDPTCYS